VVWCVVGGGGGFFGVPGTLRNHPKTEDVQSWGNKEENRPPGPGRFTEDKAQKGGGE